MLILSDKMVYNFVGVTVLLIVTGRTSPSPVPEVAAKSQDVSGTNGTSMESPSQPQVVPARLLQEKGNKSMEVGEARNCTLKALAIVLSTDGGTVSDKCREVLKSMMTNAGKQKQGKEVDPVVDLKRELKSLAKAEEAYETMNDEVGQAQELLAEKRASKTGGDAKTGEAAVDGAGLPKGSSVYDYPVGEENFGDSNFLVNSAGVGLLEDMTSSKGPDSDFLIIPLSFLRKQLTLQEAKEAKSGEGDEKDPKAVPSKKATDTNTLATWLLRALFMMDAMSGQGKGPELDIPEEGETETDSEDKEEEEEKGEEQEEEETDEGEDDSGSEKDEKESKEEDGEENEKESEEDKKASEEESDDEEKEEEDGDDDKTKTPVEIPGLDAAALERLESDISILGKDLAMLQLQSDS